MRSFHTPNRSALHAAQAAVATSHPAASLAAYETLRSGGNAVDAAVCAAAVLCVVEPVMTGLGGDGFAMVHHPTRGLHGVNGSGRAPAAASTKRLMQQGMTEIDPLGPHAVTVPGVLRCWEHLLTQFGTQDLAVVLQPAIALAQDGFIVQPRVGHDWALFTDKLASQSAGGRHYLTEGAAPKVGQRHRLPALARTLQMIASDGVDAFYHGEIAQEIAALVQSKGGLLTPEDLAGAKADAVQPVLSPYRHLEIAELPPNGVGIVAQIILNLLEPFDLAALDPNGADRLHLQIEAARVAYAIRDAYLGDPETMQIPARTLIDKALTQGVAQELRLDRRMDKIALPDPRLQSDTTYLTCVDRDGLAISLINSLYMGFGSGMVTDKSGITLQNRGAGFRLEPGHPNTLEGAKRPLHTIIPAMALQHGELALTFGVMGGLYQPVGHAHVISNMVDYGMDPQEALESPRVFWDANHVLTVEAPCPAETREALRHKGHQVMQTALPHGGGQIIQVDRQNGTLIAGSDPRKDGCALGY